MSRQEECEKLVAELKQRADNEITLEHIRCDDTVATDAMSIFDNPPLMFFTIFVIIAVASITMKYIITKGNAKKNGSNDKN